ncbi:MAG TPA: hypothetical protein VFD58_21465 [Blastocatellia bacterium]|nr:hypothetical protein [Blastocatellia bacterium]
MSIFSKEQQQQDMESLTVFLVFFNLALMAAFLIISFYQNM